MHYVQVEGDTFIRHINGFEPTQWDADNYCYAIRLTDEQVAHYGVHKKQIVTPPYFDPATQTRAEGPALLVDGVWKQSYVVTELDPEAVEAAAAVQWAVVRAERNGKLSASDWTQVADTPADAEVWATYRQALRDITRQANPFNITWPQLAGTGE